MLVAGWGEASIKHRKMECMVRDRSRPLMQNAGAEPFAMAGLALSLKNGAPGTIRTSDPQIRSFRTGDPAGSGKVRKPSETRAFSSGTVRCNPIVFDPICYPG